MCTVKNSRHPLKKTYFFQPVETTPEHYNQLMCRVVERDPNGYIYKNSLIKS